MVHHIIFFTENKPNVFTVHFTDGENNGGENWDQEPDPNVALGVIWDRGAITNLKYDLSVISLHAKFTEAQISREMLDALFPPTLSMFALTLFDMILRTQNTQGYKSCTNTNRTGNR